MADAEVLLAARTTYVGIPEQRRRAVCDRILDVSYSLADAVPFSILDGMRSTIIQLVREGLAAGAFDAESIECATQTIAQEQAKLDFVRLESLAQEE
jgi:hypothetical protein